MDTRDQTDYPTGPEGAPAVEVFPASDADDPGAAERGMTITALFTSPADAQRAVRDLHEQGFPRDSIGILMRDETVSEELVMNPTAYIAEGAVTGAVEGGLLGGALGFLVGALVVPGVGPIVAGGALASALAAAGPTALAGIGLGAATGGVVGALTGRPIPEEDAARLHEGVLGGGVAMIVHAGERPADAVAVLVRNNGDTGAERGNLNPLYHDQPAFVAHDPSIPEPMDSVDADGDAEAEVPPA